MAIPARFLLAKYIANLHRMEPINIGIILWTKGRLYSRFITDVQAVKIVNDVKVFRRWINFWNNLLLQENITARNSQPVHRSSVDFLNAMVLTQKGNYLLQDGGEILETLRVRDIESATQDLFDRLVKSDEDQIKSNQEEYSNKLKSLCQRVFDDIGLRRHEYFKTAHTIDCSVGNVSLPFKFNYAMENGTLQSVMQRVQIGKPQSVHGTAFMFEHLLKQSRLTAERCASLIYSGGDIDDESEIVQSQVKMLKEFSVVIDLADQSIAAEKIASVAGLRDH